MTSLSALMEANVLKAGGNVIMSSLEKMVYTTLVFRQSVKTVSSLSKSCTHISTLLSPVSGYQRDEENDPQGEKAAIKTVRQLSFWKWSFANLQKVWMGLLFVVGRTTSPQ